MIICNSSVILILSFNFKKLYPLVEKDDGINLEHAVESSSNIPNTLQAFATSSEQKNVRYSSINFLSSDIELKPS